MESIVFVATELELSKQSLFDLSGENIASLVTVLVI
jgi:hypothetical protein